MARQRITGSVFESAVWNMEKSMKGGRNRHTNMPLGHIRIILN